MLTYSPIICYIDYMTNYYSCVEKFVLLTLLEHPIFAAIYFSVVFVVDRLIVEPYDDSSYFLISYYCF